MYHYQPVPKDAAVGGRVYHFVPKNTVSLCWVDEADVQAVHNITKICCGGNVKRIFLLASEAQAQIWEGTYRK
jgi:hypothetical protein